MGSLVFQATLGGQVNLNGPNTASTFDIAVPATTGTMVTTGDSGTVTNTMLAASAYTTPGTIGSGTANSGAFTTLSASSTVSGAGFSAYLASPPAIGGTTAAAGTFTTLSGTTSVTTPIVKSASSLTLQSNGTTTAVTVDTSQNVGIGFTSPNARLGVSGDVRINNTSNATFSAQLNTQFSTSVQCGMYLKVTNTSLAQSMIIFGNTTSDAVGSISTSAAVTTYATSSDYRLKDNISPMKGALEKIALLKPVTYTWKVNGSNGEGFIAHELQEIVPDCVTGEKDAVSTYIDENGNEATRPVYQGIDTSFLAATLTAAIQEQQTLITSLTDRVAALEAK